MKKHSISCAKVRLAILIIILIITSIICFYEDYKISEEEKQKTEVETEHVESSKIIPVCLSDDIVVNKVDVDIVTSTEQVSNESIYYDVPLSNDLQDFIFKECEQKGIDDPALIISMIEQESSYRSNIVGDNGRSYGLMQIMAKYQVDRMKKLGCKDLLNPYDNVKVGIDIVAELSKKSTSTYWILMAYNGGQSYANRCISKNIISDYAIEVVNRKNKLTHKSGV